MFVLQSRSSSSQRTEQRASPPWPSLPGHRGYYPGFEFRGSTRSGDHHVHRGLPFVGHSFGQGSVACQGGCSRWNGYPHRRHGHGLAFGSALEAPSQEWMRAPSRLDRIALLDQPSSLHPHPPQDQSAWRAQHASWPRHQQQWTRDRWRRTFQAQQAPLSRQASPQRAPQLPRSRRELSRWREPQQQVQARAQQREREQEQQAQRAPRRRCS